MNITKYCMEYVENFNAVKTEEDLKIRVIIPFLKTLGYSESFFRFENRISVQVGTKSTEVRSDIEILVNGRVQMVIDTKRPAHSISERDIIQVISYAKLVTTPPALYGIVTNGKETVVVNVFTGQRKDIIPDREHLLDDIEKSVPKKFTEVQLREIKSVLLTIQEHKELFNVINRCKEIIEKKGLIRSDQSFREITKILLVKMNEERRAHFGEENGNRFLQDYFDAYSRVNKVTYAQIMTALFEEAKVKYPNIYNQNEDILRLTDEKCLQSIVKQLEPFSFLGTGDDIKGAVYEIFLKSTLRGDFDQYFTPREIVDFMVKFANPKVGDRILDPACGSGGFLIQAFKYVNQEIVNRNSNEKELNRKTKKLTSDLVEKCLWGNEADNDLHILAKINLIMHGDGWNHITQGDTLTTKVLKDNFFDVILTNPPFTIPYPFPDVLSGYECGIGKESEELDILFLEKSLRLLKDGGHLFIVLPEGLMNLPKYENFRKWLLEKTFVTLSISLPEGAFIPFGKSVSKTCIMGLQKKSSNLSEMPDYVFLGNAVEIGYESGKKDYQPIAQNDLLFFIQERKNVFAGLHKNINDGECGWIRQKDVHFKRLDAKFLLNLIDRESLQKKFKRFVPLRELYEIQNYSVTIDSAEHYYYLEIPDISETGLIGNIRRLKGSQITADSLYQFSAGDILFSRINPRRNRVVIIPPIEEKGVVSKEMYRIVYKNNKMISNDYKYCIVPILQSEHVKNQIVRLSTGSSSSRARVPEDDLLDNVFIPVPSHEIQKNLHQNIIAAVNGFWNSAQTALKSYVNSQNILGTTIKIEEIRTV
jgi:type I restriction enzyme M protein